MSDQPRPHLLIIILALLLSGQSSATADDQPDERYRLATLIRELDAIDRIASSGERVRDLGPSRYHFNYTLLRNDIHRISTGLQRYLSPQRARPRDDTTLHGNYLDKADPDQ